MNCIPKSLREKAQWVLWRGDKVPMQPNGQPAKSNDPATWSTFDEVMAVADQFSGIGFVFSADDDLCGIDLDGCVGPNGIESWAWDIITRFATYAEYSPSLTGVKLFCRGTLAGGKGRNRKLADVVQVCAKKPGIEVYDRKRFFCVTGQCLSDTFNDVAECQPVLDELLAKFWPPDEPPAAQAANTPRQPQPPNSVLPHDAGDVVERARQYLATIPPAVSGQGGHNTTFRAACKLVCDFALDPDTALTLLREWNETCQPPWSEAELQHKIESAAQQPGERGKLLNADRGIADASGVEIQLELKPSPSAQSASVLAAIPASADDTDEFNADDLDDSTDEPLVFPADCLTPPGLLGDIVRHNLETALYPQPQLALGGALALLATISGRKITDAFGTQPNCYILALGPTGCGKERARQLNKQLLQASGGTALLGPERIGSHSGLIAQLALSPSKLFQIDEIHRLLETMSNPHKSPHLYGIGTVLLTLYSASSEIWISDALADINKVKTIDRPNAVVYGTGTPDGFWESLTANNLTDGLVGRFSLFEGCYIDTPNLPTAEEMPKTITDRIKAWIDLTAGRGNLSVVNPTAIVLQHTDEARARFIGHLQNVASRRMTESPFNAAIWSRSPERAAKIALAFAASRWDGIGPMPEIELRDVDAAIRLSNYMTRRMLSQGKKFVAENEWDGKVKRVLRIITDNDGISKSQLSRKTQWLQERERDTIIRHLLNTFQAFELVKRTGGRAKLTYTTRRPLAQAV